MELLSSLFRFLPFHSLWFSWYGRIAHRVLPWLGPFSGLLGRPSGSRKQDAVQKLERLRRAVSEGTIPVTQQLLDSLDVLLSGKTLGASAIRVTVPTPFIDLQAARAKILASGLSEEAEEEALLDQAASVLEPRNRPKHVGIIMDGNGRWAKARGEQRTVGHRAGSRAARRVVRAANRAGVQALTLYAFSVQNWQRSDGEVTALMGFLHEFLIEQRHEILTRGIRLDAVGELDRLPPMVRGALDSLRADSAHNTKMVLTLALSYGGQEEIAIATRGLASDAVAGKLTPSSIDVEALRSRVPSLSVGDPDLIVRTGGETRLSNFLLFGSAYAELYFTDQLWPDFDEIDFCAAIASYQTRQRRFGRVLDEDDAATPK